MFSGNHKISSRQLYRNYATAFISLGALLPPLVMNREHTGSLILALLFSGAVLAGTAVIPRPDSRMARWLCYVQYWVIGTMLVRLTGVLIRMFLLTDTALWIIMGWFCLFCYYNLYKGLECRFRVSEVLFPFFLCLLLLLTVLMYGEVEGSRLLELRLTFGKKNWILGYELFCWFSAVQSLWHLRGQTRGGSSFSRTVFAVWLTGAAAVAGFGLFSYCIYGNAGHTGLVYPIASAMTLAHFPGNVIGRLDAMFIFAWIIGLFLLCSSLFAPLVDGEPDVRSKWFLLGLVALAFAAANVPRCVEWGRMLLYDVLTPVQLLLLLWHSMKGSGRKKAAAAVCLLCALLLNGCSSQELEQQSLVTAIGVDEGKNGKFHLTFGFGTADEDGEEPFETDSRSLQDAKETYWEYFQKNMDFNHLKNFYFSGTVLDQEGFDRLLEEIQIDGAYSRGTLVHVTEGTAGEQAEKEEQPEEGMPIHRVLNAWYNGESCDIPLITADGRYKGQAAWP